MFWSNENSSLDGHLRGQLRDRLLVALDFATLGAYELLETEEAPRGSRSAEMRAELPEPSLHSGPATRERPQRVFLFAKVAGPACSHDSQEEAPCNPRRETSLRQSRQARRSRRGGSTAVPDQPCSW